MIFATVYDDRLILFRYSEYCCALADMKWSHRVGRLRSLLKENNWPLSLFWAVNLTWWSRKWQAEKKPYIFLHMAYQENAKSTCGAGKENGHKEAALFILLTRAKSQSQGDLGLAREIFTWWWQLFCGGKLSSVRPEAEVKRKTKEVFIPSLNCILFFKLKFSSIFVLLFLFKCETSSGPENMVCYFILYCAWKVRIWCHVLCKMRLEYCD